MQTDHSQATATPVDDELSIGAAIRAVPVVRFRHSRLNYGQSRFVLAKDEGDALVILHGLDAFFADDPTARYGYDVLMPEHFAEKHPRLTVDTEDEFDIDGCLDYDQDNPEHAAWMKELRRLLAD